MQVKPHENEILFVTGATGHTGNYFMKRLQKEGYKGRLRCSIRAGSDVRSINNLGLDIEYRTGDLSEISFVQDCIRDVQNVIHIAGINFSRNIADVGRNQLCDVCCFRTHNRCLFKIQMSLCGLLEN